MIFADSLKSSLKSLWANKMRSFLTLLGIMIGIYSVVTLMSLAKGVQSQTTSAVESFGPTLMMIMPGEDTGAGFNFASQLAPSTLFVSDAKLIQEKADLVDPESVTYASYTGGALKKGGKAVSALPVGGSPKLTEFLTFELVEGREMTQSDMDEKAKVVFVTESIAKALDAKLNDQVTLGSLELTVVGIFRVSENGQLDPTANDTAVLPGTLVTELNRSEQVNQILLKAKDADSVLAAKDQVTKLLTEAHGTADFTVSLPSDLLEQFNQITDMLALMVVGIAAISLLVGGIGISNIMLVTVTERTREIGIRKALGATRGAILLQFLIESVILTVVGALIAIGFAEITLILVSKYSILNASITLDILILAIGMGAIAGIVFGLFPALRAARKNPVEALRFE